MLFTSMQFNDYLQKENLGQVTLSLKKNKEIYEIFLQTQLCKKKIKKNLFLPSALCHCTTALRVFPLRSATIDS